jgi:hypothetical protein
MAFGFGIVIAALNFIIYLILSLFFDIKHFLQAAGGIGILLFIYFLWQSNKMF